VFLPASCRVALPGDRWSLCRISWIVRTLRLLRSAQYGPAGSSMHCPLRASCGDSTLLLYLAWQLRVDFQIDASEGEHDGKAVLSCAYDL
jgi:hypothetical protein